MVEIKLFRKTSDYHLRMDLKRNNDIEAELDIFLINDKTKE